MKKLSCMLIMGMCVLFAMSSAFASGNVNWDSNAIVAEGWGVAPSNAKSAAQAKILARRAAVVDAYRNLGEYLQGVRIDADTTVQDMAVKSDVVKTEMNALIKGAVIKSEQYNMDGSYKVVLEIPLYGESDSLASVVLPRQEVIEAFPEPIYQTKPADVLGTLQVINTAKGIYTGVIVDCRGLNLQPVMSPVILNASSQPIYGHKNLDSKQVISKGMASYSKDGITGLERAGIRPLVVKAESLAGHNANPRISNADANLILLENQKTGFLQECAVVFIR